MIDHQALDAALIDGGFVQGRVSRTQLHSLARSVMAPSHRGEVRLAVLRHHLVQHGTMPELGTLPNLVRVRPVKPAKPVGQGPRVPPQPPSSVRMLGPVGIARKKVLFLARDPRDVAVSLYYERAKRNSPEARARAGFAEGTDALPLFDFLVERNGGALHKVVRFLNEWAAILPRLPGALRITYEEMQAQPDAMLRRVVEHLDQPFSAAEIDQAIAFASFDSLRQKEQHGFRSSKLRPGDPDDPQSFKVRRGKVGGWRDELTAIQAAEIDRIVERELVPVHLPAQQRVGLARVVARW